MNIGTLTVTLGADMTQLNASLSKTNSALQRFGFVATTALTAPMVAAGKASFQMAKDYEYAIQTIVGLTGTAQDVVNGLSQEILKMAPELARNPLELAQGAYFIMSSGIKDATKAMDVLTVSAKAATAGLGETQAVANVLTSALNAYAGSGLTASYAADILTAAVREGKAEASGFATAIGQIIPIGAQLGVGFNEVAGGMAAITLTGASAANAAVYLKGVFNSLLTASAQGETALNKMGSSYADLRRVLAEQGLIALMQKLRDMQVQYGDELISDVLPNIRALTGFLSLAGKNFEYNKGVIDKVTDSTGSLNTAFRAVADTIKVRYDSAIAAARVSIIKLGADIAKTLIPLFEQLVKKLESLVSWYDNLGEAQKTLLLKVMMLTAVLGPLSLVLSSLIWVVRGFSASFSTLLTVLGGAYKTIGVLTTNLFPTLGSSIAATTVQITAMADAASVAMATLGFGAIIAITIPIISRLHTKIMEMKREYDAIKSQLAEVDNIEQLNTKISRYLSVFNTLDAEQLTMLRQSLQERLSIEKERLLIASTTAEEDIKRQKQYIDKVAALQVVKDRLYDANLKKKQGLTTAAEYDMWAKNIQYDMQIAEDALKSYMKGQKDLIEYNKTSSQENIAFYTDLISKTQKALDKFNLAKPLQDLNKEISSFQSKPIAIPGFGGLTVPRPSVSAIPETISPVMRIMNELSNNLTAVQIKEDALNSSIGKGRDLFDENRARVSAYTTALNTMLDITPTEFNAEWQSHFNTIIDGLAKTQAEMDKYQKHQMIMSNIGNAMVDIAGQLGAAFVSSEKAWMGIVDTILTTTNAVVSALLVMAVTAETVRWGFVAGLAIAAVGLGAIGAVWAKAKAQADQGAELANGGIIPKGYPNDTFRARLSSDEAVIPLDTLWNNLKNLVLPSTQPQTVVFKIDRRQLVGLLDREDRINNSY